MESQVIAEAILAFSAILNAAVIYPVFRMLERSEKSNMARFQLNKQDTFTDFKIFLGTTLFFIIASSIWLSADILGSRLLDTVGSILSIISSLLPLIIFYRWWRRFE